jgi:uncharacterized protein YndB with AHSA1/START domain
MDWIEISTTIYAPIKTVWDAYTKAEHITGWNFASDDWHCPSAEIDFKVGGKFSYQMSAKDGSFSFDFWGYFREIQTHTRISFSLGEDLGSNRSVEIVFTETESGVTVVERFVPENEHEAEMQKQGWQMILNHFKSYCESLSINP